ncbi:Nlrc5 [Symbiodinium sp. CCMP2592]|nr:Nlrc5 [Symbiodinium sp. CCMP2592]
MHVGTRSCSSSRGRSSFYGVAFADVVEQGEFAPLSAFVSHFWGEETLSFAESLRLHGETVHPSNPGAMCYYICSFSNCQHLVDLGSDWRCSPFNRALEHVAECRRVRQQSVYCAVMLFDERCSTLERIWCIFEIWRCCQLELRLDLFTVEGQLTRRSSTPLACKIRDQAKVLDVSNTACSEMSDKRMIEAAVETSGSNWAQIAGMIKLQITSLVEFSASLAISRNALTGEEVSAEDVEMMMSETLQVRNSSSIISDCIQGHLPRLVIIGQGGCGKSIFAREVVRRAVQALKEGHHDTVIPLRVPLAELANLEDHAVEVDLLQVWAARVFGRDGEELLREDRRLILVLDGLDEAGKGRRRVLDWLQRWLQANGHRCVCTIIASRPSGTNQVLASDGSAREPAASAVLGQLSKTSLRLLTEEWVPASSHCRLQDGDGKSLGTGTVVSCEMGFLLKKEVVVEVGLELGVHQVEVRRKEPGKVFSAAVSLDYADRSAAQVLLEQAFQEAGGDPTESHRAVVRRADGKLWKDDLQKDRKKPIAWDKLVLWPKEAFPCRAFLTDTDDLDVEEDSSMDECDELSEMGVDYAMLIEEHRRQALNSREIAHVRVSLDETSVGIFLAADVFPGDAIVLGSAFHELLPFDRCFQTAMATAAPCCPSKLTEITVQHELSMQLGFTPVEILPLRPSVASRISKFGEAELEELPGAVWQTPLMASMLGTYRDRQKEKEQLDAATTELVLVKHAVEVLMSQAEKRTGAKNLRAELRPLCLAKLQAGQRLLFEPDFSNQVVFQEAQLGHLRFFEPAGQAVQLYHLIMHEYLAAEAWKEASPGYKEAFAQAQQQPMLRGALRFLLMMQTAHVEEVEIKLPDSQIGSADMEAFKGALLCSEKVALHLGRNRLGAEGASSLASVLPKNLRVLWLQLSENGLGAEGASCVASALPKNLRVLRLQLSENGLGNEGTRVLAAGLGQLPLEELALNLQCNGLGEEGDAGAALLGEALSSLGECGGKLRRLSLDFAMNRVGDDGAVALAKALSLLASELRHLSLTIPRNGVCLEGLRALAASLAQLRLEELTLDLSNQAGVIYANTLGAAAAVIPLAEALGSPALAGSLRSLSLELHHQQIGVEGMRALAAGLAKLRLEELTLGVVKNFHGDEAAIALAEALSSFGESLRRLAVDLAENAVGAKGARALSDTIAKIHLEDLTLDLSNSKLGNEVEFLSSLGAAKSLRRLALKLARNELRVEGAHALAAALAQLRLEELTVDVAHNGLGPSLVLLARALAEAGPKRLSLDLLWNDVGPEGASALSDAIAKLHLEDLTLNLGNNVRGDEVIVALAPGLSGAQELRRFALLLSQGGVGDNGACALAAALAKLHLEVLMLDLTQNSLGDESATALTAAAARLPLKETSVDLSGNELSEEGARALASAVLPLRNPWLDFYSFWDT